jgi:transposase
VRVEAESAAGDEVLKKNGFRPLKAGFLPAKADNKKQKAFVEEKLEPLIKLAKEGVVELFFVDASHFVMGGFAGVLWSRVRCFVKTACGRSRYNVLGALNFCGKKVTTVTNDTYISAEQVIMLMERLLAEYKDKVLALVLDNAAYQRCGKVTEYAKEQGIGLIFLPPYSPNLNLIERFWKLVKAKVLNAAYHGTFEDFKKTIDDCVSGSNGKHKKETTSLISENFQLFTDVFIPAA